MSAETCKCRPRLSISGNCLCLAAICNVHRLRLPNGRSITNFSIITEKITDNVLKRIFYLQYYFREASFLIFKSEKFGQIASRYDVSRIDSFDKITNRIE